MPVLLVAPYLYTAFMKMDFLEFLSAVFGLVYFAAWSVSFYPQAMLNFGRKSTSGTTVDFPLINSLGGLSTRPSPGHSRDADPSRQVSLLIWSLTWPSITRP